MSNAPLYGQKAEKRGIMGIKTVSGTEIMKNFP